MKSWKKSPLFQKEKATNELIGQIIIFIIKFDLLNHEQQQHFWIFTLLFSSKVKKSSVTRSFPEEQKVLGKNLFSIELKSASGHLDVGFHLKKLCWFGLEKRSTVTKPLSSLKGTETVTVTFHCNIRTLKSLKLQYSAKEFFPFPHTYA